MAAAFIPFFTPNLQVLAFGEAMCGIAWGVFRKCKAIKLPYKAHTADRNLVDLLCRRSGANHLETFCHRLRLHVLGSWNFALFRCPTSRP